MLHYAPRSACTRASEAKLHVAVEVDRGAQAAERNAEILQKKKYFNSEMKMITKESGMKYSHK